MKEKLKTENKILLRIKVNSTDPSVTHRFFEVSWQLVPTEHVVVHQELYNVFCKSGCKNFACNGGCPPYAPSFDALKKAYKYMVVVACRMSTSQLPKSYTETTKNRTYFAAQFMQTQLPPIMKSIYSHPEYFDADRFLGESACKLCSPCQVPITKICRHPKDRVFSLESTGINTNKLMEDFLYPLYWFNFKKPITEVPYSSKLVGFLYKEKPDKDFTKILTEILNLRNVYEAVPYKELLGDSE